MLPSRFNPEEANSLRRRADGDARRDGAQRKRQGLTARLTDELNRWERAASRISATSQ